MPSSSKEMSISSTSSSPSSMENRSMQWSISPFSLYTDSPSWMVPTSVNLCSINTSKEALQESSNWAGIYSSYEICCFFSSVAISLSSPLHSPIRNTSTTYMVPLFQNLLTPRESQK